MVWTGNPRTVMCVCGGRRGAGGVRGNHHNVCSTKAGVWTDGLRDLIPASRTASGTDLTPRIFELGKEI